MGKIKASINPFNQTDKTKGFFQNATDTFAELFGLLITAILVAGIAYALFEGKDIGTGIWWAIVTGFTVGYGDIVPHTLGAQVTGALLMTFTTFIIIPLTAALFAKKLIVNDDAWTDKEQNELMDYVALAKQDLLERRIEKQVANSTQVNNPVAKPKRVKKGKN